MSKEELLTDDDYVPPIEMNFHDCKIDWLDDIPLMTGEIVYVKAYDAGDHAERIKFKDLKERFETTYHVIALHTGKTIEENYTLIGKTDLLSTAYLLADYANYIIENEKSKKIGK